jgi:PKD domain/Glucodextranase, domain B
MKAGSLQLISHDHSGRLRHHRHTSYPGLVFLLLLSGLLLAGVSWSASAATPAVNPQSGSVGLQGVVRGPAPSQAATITSPRNGQHTSSIPITVSGVCPAGTFVSITKNDVFGGATTCQDDGTFTLQIDLFDGQNSLIARVSDALGQFGPNSTEVTVFYDAPSLGLPGGSGIGRQLFLEAATTIAATNPSQSLERSVTIVGGVGPYAVAWDWGDGATSLVSQTAEGTTRAGHAYNQPGNYRVIVRVTDNVGNAAFLQLVTVVNGPVSALGTSGGGGKGALPGALITAWPLYILAFFMVLLFWAGELRAARRLRRQSLASLA